MNGGNVIFKFQGDGSSLNNSIGKINSTFGTMTKSILTATGITKAFDATLGMIKGSTGQAISRLDTLNKFPDVMKNLGVSAEDSQASIDLMAKKLQGLPTTLNDGAMAVQRFTSKNGDVKKSTDMFLALNNALLAGGASTEIQATALEQMSQAYAKGKPDMIEWRSLMTAMPAQLKQVATAMGYVDADQLGTALREGEVSMDDFMATISKLNTEGVAGFESFEQQAKNSTGGIQTSITVMKTRVAQGMAELINSVDVGLKDFGGLSGVFTTIGDTIKGALKSLAPIITNTIGFLAKNLPTIINVLKVMAPLVLGIVGAFKAYSATVKIVSAVTKAWAVVQALLNGTLLLNPIGLIVAGIVALIAIIVALYMKCEWFRNIVNKLFSVVKQGFTTIINALKPLITTIINTAKQIMTALQPVIEFIKNLVINYIKFYINMVITYIKVVVAVIKGIIGVITWVVNGIIAGVKKVIDFAKSVPTKVRNFVNKIVNFFREMPGKMLSIGLNVVKGIGNGITNGIGWIKNKIKSFVGNVTSFIKKMFKIGSPSRLMEDQVGQWIPKGIAVGIDANTDSVYSAMKTMQEDISSSFGLNPQTIGSSSLNYSPNVIVNNTVNMSQDPLGRMVGDIKTFANGAKNDYNYGMGV